MGTSGGRQTTFWPAPRCETCGCPLLPLLTADQVAEALQLSRRHVYRLAYRGDLDWRRVGSRVRIRHESVHEHLGSGGPDPDWWVEMEAVQSC